MIKAPTHEMKFKRTSISDQASLRFHEPGPYWDGILHVSFHMRRREVNPMAMENVEKETGGPEI